jgi:hypothetical protein
MLHTDILNYCYYIKQLDMSHRDSLPIQDLLATNDKRLFHMTNNKSETHTTPSLEDLPTRLTHRSSAR